MILSNQAKENAKFNSDKLEFHISVSVTYREFLSRWSKYYVHLQVGSPKETMTNEVTLCLYQWNEMRKGLYFTAEKSEIYKCSKSAYFA